MSEPLMLYRESSPADGSGEMFDRIAGRYDLLNSILSLGRDGAWRRRAVQALRPAPGGRFLDAATGTADLALELLRLEPEVRVEAIDPASRMLDLGREKVRKLGLEERIELREGDVQELPFAHRVFDGAAIAFGIRNVPDRLRGLREMARVVRPGGRVVVLELTEPEGPWIGPLARTWVRQVVPRLGGLLAGWREYRYLQQSIEEFPPVERFVELMREAGLEEIETTPLTFGVCHLFVGRLPAIGPGRTS